MTRVLGNSIDDELLRALTAQMRTALNLPEKLSDLKDNPTKTLEYKTAELREWSEKKDANIWKLHLALGVRPHEYSEDSGRTYKKPNFKAIGELVWQPDPNKEELVQKLKSDLKQEKKPTNLADFFYNPEFTKWMRENNFHSLRHFTEYFNVPMIESKGENRTQAHLDLESLAPEIWPAESLNGLYELIKDLSPKRPENLAKFFSMKNKRLMNKLAKNGFSTLIEFFRYVGAVKQERQTDPETGKITEPIFDYQGLARKIWKKPKPEKIPAMLRTSVQEHRPSNLKSFFESDPEFRDWLAENGFVNLTSFARSLGAELELVYFNDRPKAKINFEDLANKIWIKADQNEVIQMIHDEFGQGLRPKKPKEFFTSNRFKKWLEKNNFESIVVFAKYLGAEVDRREIVEYDREEPRTKATNYVNYDSLARQVWQTPKLSDIKKEIQEISSQEGMPKSPHKFFRTKEIKEWLMRNNFRDLSHFCEVIKVPTSRRESSDRTNGKISYNWQAMLDKLGLS